MSRILVTYGWCRTAYVAVQSLASREHDVYVCSHLQPSMAAWSRFCTASARVADHVQAPEAFIQDVISLVQRWKIDAILPCHEDSLTLRRHEQTLPGGVVLACPSLLLLEQGVDKATVTRLAVEEDIRVPTTQFPADLEEAELHAHEIGFPLVVKLRQSNSAKGVTVVDNLEALHDTLSKPPFLSVAADDVGFPILQAYIPGDVVGACFLAVAGQVVAFFGERYLRVKSKGMGTSTFREPFSSEALRHQVERLVSRLRWEGIGHFDFIENPATGEFSLLEMNPRLWGALNLARVNGLEFPAASVALALGETDFETFFPPMPQPPKRSLWLLGEGIRCLDLMASRQWREVCGVPREVLGSLRATRCDDWHWKDPLPFLAEVLCYAKGYVRSGGNVNPVVPDVPSSTPSRPS